MASWGTVNLLSLDKQNFCPQPLALGNSFPELLPLPKDNSLTVFPETME